MRRALRLGAASLLLGFAAAGHAQEAPASFDARFTAAQQLVRDGRRDEALAAFGALLERSPGNADVLLARGRLHGWMKHWPEAEADLTAATRRAPGYADAWSALADLYRWTGRPVEAAAAHERWAELAPAEDVARARAAEREKTRASLTPDAVAPRGFDWTARVDGSQTWVSGTGSSDFQNYGLSVRRHFEAWSLAGEVLGVHRFGKRDTAYALDAYADLWERAYANLRYQAAPDHALFPENSGRVELYQGVGQGWEPAASYDWLNFSSTSVGIYGVALAKYLGPWYGRLRTTYVDTSGSVGWRLAVRNYYAGDADQYVEATAGTSRGDVSTRGVVSVQTTTSVSFAWVMFPTPRWGLKLGADYADAQPAETGVSATLYRRW